MRLLGGSGGYIETLEINMETATVYKGSIGIMEMNMETTKAKATWRVRGAQ